MFRLSHVALEAQCDVALPQRDVAGLFSPFFELKWSFLPSHVALEAQCDVDPAQHDVAGAQLTPKPQPYRLPLRCG